MALKYRCFLDDVQVEEPINLGDINISITRDEDLHGIGFEASETPLVFSEDGFVYLEQVKESLGLKANVTFRWEQSCDDDSDEWEVVLEGKVNMGQYKKHCGDNCTISVPIESKSAEVVLQNRMDQSVDVDKQLSFNGSVLANYFNLGIDMVLPAKGISLIDKATLSKQTTEIISDQIGWGIDVVGNEMLGYIAPAFDTILYSALGSFNVGSFIELFPGGFANNPDPTNNFQPVTVNAETILGNIQCQLTNTVINFRFKGSATSTGSGGAIQLFYKVWRLPKGLDPTIPASWVALYSQLLATWGGNSTFSFDVGDSLSVPDFIQGDWIIASVFIHVFSFSDISTFSITQDIESFIDVETDSLCEDSSTKAYLVHETLSRVVESITDNAVRVKSTYYGRTDSEPFDFPADGCGSLRMLTSGLKIRNAENPTFFASPKSLITGLQDIDNIGMGVEPDPDRPGYLLLRVEDLDFFYRDEELIRCDAINAGDDVIDAENSFASIKSGYAKWEITNTNGLDEFNSTREFRTALTSLSNILDITTDLVAGGYPIEITRQQSFADTGAADTTYDNETFIICLKRITAAGYPYGEMVVEQGGVDDPGNMFSPDTIYNYRISPLRNLMRWFRSIAACYPNILDSDNRLYFNAGTGNLLAKGELSELYGGTCRLEKVPIQENQDVNPQIFLDPAKALPLWKNETFTYDYPMSLKDYKAVKANPYGYISYQCGNGPWQKGWIKELSYKPTDGMATFTLKRKWS